MAPATRTTAAAALVALALGALVWWGVFKAVSGPAVAGAAPAGNAAVLADMDAGPSRPVTATGTGGAAAPPAAAAPAACGFEPMLTGRPRSTESALISACRKAAQSAGAATVPQANAQMKLGQFYAESAQQQVPGAAADALRARAVALVAESGAIYQRVLGSQASRTRVASQRLLALTRPEQAAMAPEAIAVLDDDELARLTGTMGAAAAPAAPGMALATALRQPDVAQADHDLARLQEQARGVARDPDGFAQRLQEADTRRQACQDEACVRGWYAQRRRELLGEFSAAP